MACVQTLVRAGATVTVLARQKGHSPTDEAMRADPAIDFKPLDIADSAAVARTLAEVAGEKGIDIAVLNAGTLAAGRFGETRDETWHHVMAVNLDGLICTTRESVKHMTPEFVLDPRPGLKERRAQSASTLSGGERRMAIGRGLMASGHLRMPDEPKPGLASTVIDEICAVITKLAETGRPVLPVEENVSNAVDVADVMAPMNRGQIVRSGQPSG